MTDQKEMMDQKELDAKDLDKVVGGIVPLETEHGWCNLWVDEDLCICCGICESECPTGAISCNGNSYQIDRRECVACYCCVDVCPVRAIQVL